MNIINATQTSFTADVLEKSLEKPVVVDFWASWCQPCLMLDPILKELASENNDEWQLVKVNVDENPELSQAYQIKGIPAIKVFHNKKIIGEFNGLMYKPQMKQWLNGIIPNPETQLFDEIKAKLDLGASHLTIQDELKNFIQQYPSHIDAKTLLAKLLAWDNISEADTLVQDIQEDYKDFNTVQSIRTLKELQELEDIKELQDLKQLLNQQKIEESLEEIINITIQNKAIQNELPRRLGVAMFTLLGSNHELTQKYRRRFDSALY
jgi:putative thioredoxin